MVKDVFDTLLEEVGRSLEIPDLHPDSHHSCLIKLINGVSVQIEMDSQLQFITLGSDLGSLPTGKYRENVFREALKTNAQSGGVLHGVLAFSNKTDHLVLFKQMPMQDLTGEKIADEIAPFSEKALHWKNALEHGEVPVVSNIHTSAGMFGLRP